jgi:hypothetical protein
MSYQYDVFFSYKHTEQSLYWHEKVKDLLQGWLTQELGGINARIFMDREEIKTGQDWKDRLGIGLKHSKCLVPVWSPSYFQSPYCLSEWRAFQQRETIAARKLIAPIRYHDGDFFPAEARKVQMADFRNLTSNVDPFWGTRRAVMVEDKIKLLAQDVATLVKQAPDFDSEWQTELVDDVPTEPVIKLAKL